VTPSTTAVRETKDAVAETETDGENSKPNTARLRKG
jgi:hypothetical protein